MRERISRAAAAAAALSAFTAAGEAEALNKRQEVVQQGDFILIGNTLAQECKPGTPQPKVGTVVCPAMGVADIAPDVLWRAEGGAANANPMITVAQAQSAAVLQLPAGATVTHAYLNWSARNFMGADNQATLTCIGAPPLDVSAQSSLTGADSAYHSSSDVTQYVQANGSCTYLVGSVSSVDFKGANDAVGHAVWWMVVLYSHPSEPHRQLVVYDGLDSIGNGAASTSLVESLLVPKDFAKASAAKVGVVGYDGTHGLVGDQVLFVDDQTMTETPLKDSSGDPNDFFNSTRSYLGAPLSVFGDLPELAGTPGSMSHLDMDVVDITDLIQAGDTSVQFKAKGVEPAYVGGLVTSIPTFTDADNDGVADDVEVSEGLNPNDDDTDDDGVLDGQEGCPAPMCADPAWNVDSDGDGDINAADPDSDNDGLFDGTEYGLDCSNPDTDKMVGDCIPDGDQGKTTTDPLDADTDDGGVPDGAEDFDKDGQYEPNQGEGNPLDPSDDVNVVLCSSDHPSCGPENSGVVCDDVNKICVSGCRDVDGSRCPEGQLCIIEGANPIGYCVEDGDPDDPPGDDDSEPPSYEGCECALPGRRAQGDLAWALSAVAVAGAMLRRRPRPKHRT